MKLDKEAQELINRYLDEGLVLYGLGEFKKAVEKWRQILKIDPDNEQAKDYIISAGYSVEEEDNTLQKIKELINERKFEEAYDLAKPYIDVEPENTELKHYMEILNDSLNEKYNRTFKNLKAIPKMKVDLTDLLNYSLTQQDGFVISLIDGKSTIQEIIDTSGINAFDCKRILSKLMTLGIIEINN